MRLASNVHPIDELQTLIKNRFAEFNRRSKASRGRRYPPELRELICRGNAAGLLQKDLKRLSGMSQTAIRNTLSKARPEKAIRLEVVGIAPEAQQILMPLIIRLPSGVSIELSASTLLTETLLNSLAQIGGKDASSR